VRWAGGTVLITGRPVGMASPGERIAAEQVAAWCPGGAGCRRLRPLAVRVWLCDDQGT